MSGCVRIDSDVVSTLPYVKQWWYHQTLLAIPLSIRDTWTSAAAARPHSHSLVHVGFPFQQLVHQLADINVLFVNIMTSLLDPGTKKGPPDGFGEPLDTLQIL